MPITWDELEEVEPDHWTIGDAPERATGMRWEGFEDSAVNLEVAHGSLRLLLETQGLELERFDRFRS